MTRKHYQALADALRSTRPDGYDATDTPEARLAWDRTVRAIAETLRTENANFNTDRFLTACYA